MEIPSVFYFRYDGSRYYKVDGDDLWSLSRKYPRSLSEDWGEKGAPLEAWYQGRISALFGKLKGLP